MPDMVNEPPHYISKVGLESIDVIEAFELNYRLGNAVKYILRYGKKSQHPTEDLKKARWYLDREIKIREEAWMKEMENRPRDSHENDDD